MLPESDIQLIDKKSYFNNNKDSQYTYAINAT